MSLSVFSGTAREIILKGVDLKQLFRLRHSAFYEKHQWSVNSIDELEFDYFDICNPKYIIVQNGNKIVGGWRALPTTGPYMLEEVFSELLLGAHAPKEKSIWELSRFVIDSEVHKSETQSLNAITRKMIKELPKFADENRISRFITVTSLSLERLMLRSNIPLERFAGNTPIKIGKVKTVTCWVNMCANFRMEATKL